MAGQQSDLSIEEVLNDPMILALRQADRVDARAFETLLRSRALALGGPQHGTAPPADGPERRSACAPSVPAHLCRRMLDGLGQGARPGSSRAW